MPDAVDLSDNKIFHERETLFHKTMSNVVLESKKAISMKYVHVYKFRYRIRIQVPDVTRCNLVAEPKGALY